MKPNPFNGETLRSVEACLEARVETHPSRTASRHTTATGTEKTSPAKTKPPIVSTEHAGN
ncbi:hypothetical protein Bca52824_088845 [Brassica carinata]|uniref:Uncharacterized protein n=1 Tax=Brassica carinata TaxID=52824 RepID=A0A8X7PE16_BRACI|nr:hypothetical protein Bca52824_088845 [Brassica carinata]